VVLGDEVVDLVALIVTLSWSRRRLSSLSGGTKKEGRGPLSSVPIAYRPMFFISSVTAETRSPTGATMSLAAEV
jgi:hypothetical protein